MTERFTIDELPNGLTLLGQQMEHVASASVALALPAGAACDPPGAAGTASVACEWLLRGAGDRDTRRLNDALDALGCQHHESVRSEVLWITASQLGRNLLPVLGILADMVRRPRFGGDTFDACRDLIAQDLAALEDEPARKAGLLLRDRFYPPPLGRCVYGTPESLAALTPDGVREHFARRATPHGAVLAVAGAFDAPAVAAAVERLFGDWAGEPAAPPATAAPAGGVEHVSKASAQSHIAIAHRSVTVAHRQYYAARLAEMVLSGGPAARLHTEIREKRGLVYHVSAHYHSLREHAGLFTYAGTRPEQAQETFERTVAELRRLGEGVGDDELTRARTQLRSALVMEGESTGARAHALVSDWLHLGRLRPLAELSEAVEATGADDVLAHLADHPAEELAVLTLGPEPIDTAAVE